MASGLVYRLGEKEPKPKFRPDGSFVLDMRVHSRG